MVTRQQFIDTFKHEIAGLVVDAATAGRSGAELALWLRGAMQRIDVKIGVMYDALIPPPPVPVKPETNGKHPATVPAQSPARK